AARQGDQLIRPVNEYSVAHLETAPPDSFHAHAHIQRSGIDDLPLEIARSRNQRGAFAFAGLLAFEAGLPDQLDARRFEVGEINRVVDVALRVHVAPAHFDGLPVVELVAHYGLIGHWLLFSNSFSCASRSLNF